MQVATYTDGRGIEYDEATQQFSMGGAPLSNDLVLGYDRAGELVWASSEMRGWFYQLAGVPLAPPQTPVPAMTPPVKKKKTGLIIIGIIFGVLLLCGVIAVISGGLLFNAAETAIETEATDAGETAQEETAQEETAQEETAQEETAESFEDGTLTTPEMKIVITDHKVIQPGKKGNEYGEKPVIAFWYKVTNVSGEKLNPTIAWIGTMNAYQDNNPNAENELEISSLPDDRFLDTQTENIKQGGTVKNAVAYELDDTKTPVDLVAYSGLRTDEIGRTQYEIE